MRLNKNKLAAAAHAERVSSEESDVSKEEQVVAAAKVEENSSTAVKKTVQKDTAETAAQNIASPMPYEGEGEEQFINDVGGDEEEFYEDDVPVHYDEEQQNDETPHRESLEEIIAKCFKDDSAFNLEIRRLQPYRKHIFSENPDVSDIIDNIERYGITNPLLVRSVGSGCYEIMSGNRRKAAAEELNWVRVPCVIGDKQEITDEYADRIVVESNKDRLGNLKLSEKIRVSAIIGESEAIKEFGLTKEQAVEYVKLDSLIQPFLEMLDAEEVSQDIAEKISFLSETNQELILKTLQEHTEMKLGEENSAELLAEENLTEEKIAKILTPKPPVDIAVPSEEVYKYLRDKTAEERTEIVIEAIRGYFNGQN